MHNSPHFVTNFNPAELDGKRLVRVAKALDIPAWIGEPINGMEGADGFYVHIMVRNLTQFWDVIFNDRE